MGGFGASADSGLDGGSTAGELTALAVEPDAAPGRLASSGIVGRRGQVPAQSTEWTKSMK